MLWLIAFARRRLNGLQALRRRFNASLRGMRPAFVALAAAGLLSAALLLIMLFVPPFLGAAPDGSAALDGIMARAGLTFPAADSSAPPGAYFVRRYATVPGADMGFSPHIALIRAAIGLSRLITRGGGFDIRFLAALYVLLYLPALLLLLHGAAKRALYFSEKAVILLLGVVLFADSFYLSYFSSLYPQPLWFVLLLYLAGLALNMAHHPRFGLPVFLFALAGSLLCMAQRAHALLCVLPAAFLLRRMRDFPKAGERILLVILSAVTLFSGLFSILLPADDVQPEDHLHAMTRGVLLQSANPDKTLAEFGIDARFAILADVSAFEAYPFVTGTQSALQADFLQRYDTPAIALYYLRHPFAALAMLDLCVRAAMNAPLAFGGNFERSEGMPPGARSVFWRSASIFKAYSLPKTIGFVLLLLPGYVLLLRKKRHPAQHGQALTTLLDTLLLIVLTGLLSAFLTAVRSGDAQMLRQSFLTGASVDLLLYLSFAEVLHRLNLLEADHRDREGKA